MTFEKPCYHVEYIFSLRKNGDCKITYKCDDSPFWPVVFEQLEKNVMPNLEKTWLNRTIKPRQITLIIADFTKILRVKIYENLVNDHNYTITNKGIIDE